MLNNINRLMKLSEQLPNTIDTIKNLEERLNTLENLELIKPNRVELYTFDYAHNYKSMNHESIKPYKEVVNYIKKNFPIIDFNAGHDLNLENLNFFLNEITSIKEVSIGHAIVIDSINFGLENTIKKYLKIIKDVSR